ncbi:MAG: rod-binding protein [Paracoccaceae bacterium]|jgi:flagellar protein FlgJ|nr:rod-binding protein [Paracoccaceae bacterium]
MNDNLMSITPAHTSVVQKSVENRTADDKASLAEVSEQFEAIFVNELMKAARAAKLFDDPLDTAGSAPFLEMMDHEISKTVSEQSDLGIAEAIVNQFSRK